MMDHIDDEGISKALLYKNISLFISLKMGSKLFYGERNTDRGTKTDGRLEGLGHSYIDPSLLLIIPRCVIFRALHLYLFCFPAWDHCGPLPHQGPGGQSQRLTESLLAARLKLTVTLWVPVYI